MGREHETFLAQQLGDDLTAYGHLTAQQGSPVLDARAQVALNAPHVELRHVGKARQTIELLPQRATLPLALSQRRHEACQLASCSYGRDQPCRLFIHSLELGLQLDAPPLDGVRLRAEQFHRVGDGAFNDV